MMTLYEEIIMQGCGCTADEVAEVEDILRQDVFHSTLDWQTKAQLKRGAKKAYAIYKDLHRPLRNCKNCGAQEQTDGIYTNILEYLGVCADCVNKAMAH